MSVHDQMGFEVGKAIRHFKEINEAEGLNQQDKEHLKGAYLQNYFTPNARALLSAKLAEEKAREERRNLRLHRTGPRGSRHPQTSPRPATSGHTPNDR